MGSTFTNVSFKKNLLRKKDIMQGIKKAQERIGLQGGFYIYYNEDDDWVTAHSDFLIGAEYHTDFSKSLSKVLRIPILTVDCQDSDFLYLRINMDGKVDICWINKENYYSYGDDEVDRQIDIPNMELWSSFLPKFDDQARFREILNEEILFAEDSLTPLSEIFGFKKKIINLKCDEIEDDKNANSSKRIPIDDFYATWEQN